MLTTVEPPILIVPSADLFLTPLIQERFTWLKSDGAVMLIMVGISSSLFTQEQEAQEMLMPLTWTQQVMDYNLADSSLEL